MKHFTLKMIKYYYFILNLTKKFKRDRGRKREAMQIIIEKLIVSKPKIY